jgi:DNA invertase Pin-like site-specific DNA recombinase
MKYNYCRVSTDRQKNERQRLALLEKFGEGVSVDEKRSGKRGTERPYFDAMVEKLRPGDEVRILCLDRVSRWIVSMHEMASRITAKGATLRIGRPELTFAPLDKSDPTKELIFNIFGSIAQFERENTIERINDSIHAMRSGIQKVNGKKRIISYETIDQILQDVDEGLSQRKIAAKYGIGKTAVYEITKKRRKYEVRKQS